MEQVKVKMSENCEQMYNTLLKGCGLTREDINKTDYEKFATIRYNREYDICFIEFVIMNIMDVMSSIDYELIYCGEQAVELIDCSYLLPNEQCLEFMDNNEFQIVFGIFNDDDCKVDKMVVFEVYSESRPSYFVKRIIFSDNSGNTVLFEENKGFIDTQEQTAPTEEQSNSTNNKDLETRVNNIEEKLDTLIKMISK